MKASDGAKGPSAMSSTTADAPMTTAPTSPSPKEASTKMGSLTEQVTKSTTARVAEIDRQVTAERQKRDAANAAIKGLLAEKAEAERVLNALKPKAPRTKKDKAAK